MSAQGPGPADGGDDRPRLPHPEERPTLNLWPEVGALLGLSRSSVYEAARRGEIPTIRFSRRLLVPTAALRRLLGIDLAIHPADTPSIQDHES